jgi:hypothetical protein
MTCVALGPPVLPTIPDFFLAGPQFTGPVIGVDVTCCRFQITIPQLDAFLAGLNAAVATAMLGLSGGVMVQIAVINEVIHQAQIQLNQLVINVPSCPLDGSTLST